jgi:TatD DNase family protein
MHGIIDTHVHLDHLGDDGPALLQAAVDMGVVAMIGNGVDPRRRALLKGNVPAGLQIGYAVGLHPQELPALTDDDIEAAFVALEARLHTEPDIVAIGECGLDARSGIGDTDEQRRRQLWVFERHLRLVRTTGLPLIVHGVRRDGPLLQLLKDDLATHGPLPAGGVWHGFSASRDTMQLAVGLGLHISVGFMALSDNARRLREAIPAIPTHRLLVETDAPPLPPARIVDVIAAIATLRGTDADSIAAHAADNARALFDLSRCEPTLSQRAANPDR